MVIPLEHGDVQIEMNNSHQIQRNRDHEKLVRAEKFVEKFVKEVVEKFVKEVVMKFVTVMKPWVQNVCMNVGKV